MNELLKLWSCVQYPKFTYFV